MSFQPQNRSTQRRLGLQRNTHRGWVAGVCAGIADATGLSPNIVRLLFVLSMLLPGPQLIFYLVAWIIIPKG